MLRRLIFIFWPSFIIGGIAEGLFFTVFDPMQMPFFGEPMGWSRIAVYSVGFFMFWAICAASSAFTCFLQRGPSDINR
jgi:hypothetical protein